MRAAGLSIADLNHGTEWATGLLNKDEFKVACEVYCTVQEHNSRYYR